MCVCVCIYIYASIINTHIFTYMHIYTHVYMHIYIHTCLHVGIEIMDLFWNLHLWDSTSASFESSHVPYLCHLFLKLRKLSPNILQSVESFFSNCKLMLAWNIILLWRSTLAWKIPWTEEPGGLQSMGSLGVGHDWATSLSLFTFMHWRRKWQPTPVFLPGESQGRGSLVGCRLWGRTESDTTEET